jgi:hypothetical protein
MPSTSRVVWNLQVHWNAPNVIIQAKNIYWFLFLIMPFDLEETFYSLVWWDMTWSRWPLKAFKAKGSPHHQLQYWRHGMLTKYTSDSRLGEAFQPTTSIWILCNCPTSMKVQCKSTTSLDLWNFQWHRRNLYTK